MTATRSRVRRSIVPALVLALVVAAVLWYAAPGLERPASTEAEGAVTPTATIPAGTAAGSPAPPVTQAPPQPEENRRCTPAEAGGIPAQDGRERALPSATEARTALAGLTIDARRGGDAYCRGRFGPDTWPDLDRNGCSTRQDVLVRQAVQVVTRRIAAHGNTCEEAISGIWVDPYTGEQLTFTNLKDPTQAQRLQVDHVVPLYNAWVSGARDWTDEQRVAFANDLAAPELRAVAGSVNFAKHHAGAESWQPVESRRCDYARAYVSVKATYRLTVTRAERDALAGMLDSCG
ncbi:MAG TPA: DUF1524 domain-containing protein [Dermatophilaceae bacterium]|nr:DUF1524 domain-containing protein [Dermatophilaceae bacterium]